MPVPVSETEEPITGINVIPLVDIVLVLLIIFMMTASFIVAPAVDVDLPAVSQAEESPSKSLHFIVDPSGAIHLNDRTLGKEEVVPAVKKALEEDPELQVLVSADRSVSYGTVVELLDRVRTGGVKRFAISVETVSGSS